MLEAVNHSWFLLINASPLAPQWALQFATFCAERLILVAPLLVAALWLWGSDAALDNQRRLAVKTLLALVCSLALAQLIGHLCPHDRPFVEGLGTHFLAHSVDNSFPSDHGTAGFTFAFAFMMWHRAWSGLLLLVGTLFIAWSRIYLGVHWPLDMVGGALTALCGCLLAQVIWQRVGESLLARFTALYHRCLAMPIRKGWIRD